MLQSSVVQKLRIYRVGWGWVSGMWSLGPRPPSYKKIKGVRNKIEGPEVLAAL